jgi:hypothetical protein
VKKVKICGFFSGLSKQWNNENVDEFLSLCLVILIYKLI